MTETDLLISTEEQRLEEQGLDVWAVAIEVATLWFATRVSEYIF